MVKQDDMFEDDDEVGVGLTDLGRARARLVRAQAEVKIARLFLRELEGERMRELGDQDDEA